MLFENKIFVGARLAGKKEVYKLTEGGWVEKIKDLDDVVEYLERVLPPLSKEEKTHIKSLFKIII